ncbi:MAG: hypothetical protein IT318_23710 [Anaerolineales bacterium]|nr:hypothetical protein [Anaerolineales bacterium]
MPSREFLFTELNAAVLRPGAAFDGLAVGTFRDMRGQVVMIKSEELETYVANTLAAINVTRSESGELVGLPIDARDHDKGDGAGWIVGAEVAGTVVRLFPRWTKIGRELIGESIRRFFSATVDTANKVILGGTLTNWPATRDPQGKILLRPIELQAGLFELSEDSLDEQAMQVRQAFHAAHQPQMDPPYVLEVYADYVICRYGDALYRVAYKLADEGVTFAPASEWVEVEPAYVEAARPPGTGDAEGVLEMEITEDKLKEMIAGAVTAALAKGSPPPPSAPPPTVDLSSFFNLDGLSEEATAARKAQIEAHLSLVRQQAQLEYQAQLAQVQRESVIAELSTRVTGGTAEAPRGIPGTTAAELQAHLLKLEPADAKWFGDLLARIVKDGLVEFAELGHGRRLQGLTPVPEHARESLQAALDAGNTAAQFFELAGLGDAAQYDLSAFKPAAKKE